MHMCLQAHLRHSQLEERRKARLLQVREQERILARQLRERVKHKRETERRVLKEHIESAFIQAHEKELRELEEKYMSRLSSVGQGHRDAQQVNEVCSVGHLAVLIISLLLSKYCACIGRKPVTGA